MLATCGWRDGLSGNFSMFSACLQMFLYQYSIFSQLLRTVRLSLVHFNKMIFRILHYARTVKIVRLLVLGVVIVMSS